MYIISYAPAPDDPWRMNNMSELRRAYLKMDIIEKVGKPYFTCWTRVLGVLNYGLEELNWNSFREEPKLGEEVDEHRLRDRPQVGVEADADGGRAARGRKWLERLTQFLILSKTKLVHLLLSLSWHCSSATRLMFPTLLYSYRINSIRFAQPLIVTGWTCQRNDLSKVQPIHN